MPLRVSVVIPAYNAAAYLVRTIESVLAQTLPADEIIIVDDGSDDRTADLVRQFEAHVRYIHQQNTGASAARNRGIEAAGGEVVAFLDADDEFLPHHLQLAREALGRHCRLKWYGASYIVRLQDGTEQKQGPRAGSEWMMGEECLDYFSARAAGVPFHPDTMVIRRGVFDEVGGFDTNLRRGNDVEMWFRIALQYPEISYSAKPGAVYWQHLGSLSIDQKRPKSGELLYALERDCLRAREVGRDALTRARPLLTANTIRLVKQAIYENDRPVICSLKERFSNELPWRWRALAGVLSGGPDMLWSFVVRMALRKRRAYWAQYQPSNPSSE